MSQRFKDMSPDLVNDIRPLIHKLGISALATIDKGSIFTFIAARPNEGTTTLAAAFAKVVNDETGKKTLLIETASNDPAIGAGIVELVTGGSDIGAALTSLGPNLYSCRWSAGLKGQSQSGRVIQDKAFWQSLQNNFDVIVIAAPSVQTSSDGIAFAQAADMTVMVVEAETTRKQVVENLRNALTSANVKIAGMVMNKRQFYIPAKVYRRL